MTGVVLVVDATEGVMSQTKFVVGKAIHHGLLPVVVINKVRQTDTLLVRGPAAPSLSEYIHGP